MTNTASGVLVAMSGGVDSSTAAALLLDEGHKVVGATMKLLEESGQFAPPPDSFGRSCCSASDFLDAKNVALKLNIDHQIHNFSSIFKDKVIERFISSYLSGLTPNPCVDCNRFVKFGPLLERAGLLGCDRLATGHYARIVFDPASKRHLLKKARDLSKDQSYFLYCLTQEELARTLFPLGEHSKDKVRDMARSRGLVNAEKPDSQDICFVPDGRYYRFVEQYGPPAKPGDIVNSEGQILGRHVGLHRYTVGQRKRLNICGPEPLYVTGLDPKNNAVAVGQEKELYSVGAVINDVNLIALDKIDKPLEVQARLRYRQKDLPAVVEPLDDGRLLLSFRTPQKAVAPGQAAVFYQDDLVIGGGVIESAKK